MSDSGPGSRAAGNEEEITRGLLSAVSENSEHTQRTLAQELGIALGLANSYIKRCARKGWIKISQVPANRYAYYLTPSGFAEKSRLTAEFLSQSFNLFRQARKEYSEILDSCVSRGWSRIGLCGVGDLSEIVILYSKDRPIEIAGIVDRSANEDVYTGVRVVSSPEDLGPVDVIILTDIKSAQSSYDFLVSSLPRSRVVVPKLLEVRSRAEHPGTNLS